MVPYLTVRYLHSKPHCCQFSFLGDSAFPNKLSPQQIPASVDLEDSIIDIWCEKDSKAQSVDDMSRNAIVFLNAAQL